LKDQGQKKNNRMVEVPGQLDGNSSEITRIRENYQKK
jgi:hypothetical protein